MVTTFLLCHSETVSGHSETESGHSETVSGHSPRTFSWTYTTLHYPLWTFTPRTIPSDIKPPPCLVIEKFIPGRCIVPERIWQGHFVPFRGTVPGNPGHLVTLIDWWDGLTLNAYSLGYLGMRFDTIWIPFSSLPIRESIIDLCFNNCFPLMNLEVRIGKCSR